jgi:outer membrane protein assembly factor BamA
MYPNEGYLLEASVQLFDEDWSGNHTYQRYNLDANGFYDIAELFVLGLRAHIESGRGDVPFYAMPSFGGSDLRGYKYGKYRDKNMWATQAEARFRFTPKWGGVAFAGIGNVMASFDKEGFVDPLSSGGLGVRYRIADKNPLDFRVDVAYGDDEVSWYFSVGQAFP